MMGTITLLKIVIKLRDVQLKATSQVGPTKTAKWWPALLWAIGHLMSD